MDIRLDVKGSYPFGEVALNTCKETTMKEIIKIGDVPESVFRMENMGVSSGQVNAVAWCMNMMNFPTHEEVLVKYCEETGAKPRVSFTEASSEQFGQDSHHYQLPCALF